MPATPSSPPVLNTSQRGATGHFRSFKNFFRKRQHTRPLPSRPQPSRLPRSLHRFISGDDYPSTYKYDPSGPRVYTPIDEERPFEFVVEGTEPRYPFPHQHAEIDIQSDGEGGRSVNTTMTNASYTPNSLQRIHMLGIPGGSPTMMHSPSISSCESHRMPSHTGSMLDVPGGTHHSSKNLLDGHAHHSWTGLHGSQELVQTVLASLLHNEDCLIPHCTCHEAKQKLALMMGVKQPRSGDEPHSSDTSSSSSSLSDRQKMRLPLEYKFSKRIPSRTHQAHIHHHLATKSHVIHTPGYRSHASNLQRSKCIDLTLIGEPPVKLAEDPTLSSPIYLPYHAHASNLQFRRSKSVDLPCHTHASNLQFRRSKSVDLTLISESPVKLAEDPTLRSPIYVPYHNLPTTSGDSTDDADRMCSDPEPDQGFQQQFLQFLRYKFSKRIPSHAHQAHIHHHLTTKSHVIHTPGYRSHASNLQRRRSKSVDLTPISESPMKLAEDPTLRLPIYLPSHNPPTTSGDSTDAADGVCSDPEPEPGLQRQFLLREISISADNIPAVCVNDCPLTPTPLRFKDRLLAAIALSPVRHQCSSWIRWPMLSRQQAHQTQKQLRPTFKRIPKQRRMLGLVKSWKQADRTQKQLSGGSSDTLATSIPPPGQTWTWTASDSSFTVTETLC